MCGHYLVASQCSLLVSVRSKTSDRDSHHRFDSTSGVQTHASLLISPPRSLSPLSLSCSGRRSPPNRRRFLRRIVESSGAFCALSRRRPLGVCRIDGAAQLAPGKSREVGLGGRETEGRAGGSAASTTISLIRGSERRILSVFLPQGQ